MAESRVSERPEIPFIDPNVEHVGVSNLRQLDGKKLRKLEKRALVIQEHNSPLAVLLSYEQYLIIQDQLRSVMETLEVFASAFETEKLIAGIKDLSEGRTRDLEQIRNDLKNDSKK